MSITWHRHHIVPKHAGGSDDNRNLIKCNIAMHAFLHEQLYAEHENEFDNIAARMLRGQIKPQEATRLAQVESGKRTKNLIREHTHSSKTKISEALKGIRRSDETKEKLSQIASTRTGGKNPRYRKANIYNYDTDTLVASEVCVSEWAKENKVQQSSLSRTALFKRKQTAGYYARYV